MIQDSVLSSCRPCRNVLTDGCMVCDNIQVFDLNEFVHYDKDYIQQIMSEHKGLAIHCL